MATKRASTRKAARRAARPKRTAKKTAGTTARRPAKRAPKRVAKKAAKRAARKATRRAPKRVARKAAKKAPRRAARKVAKKVAKRAPKRAAKRAAKPVARKPAKRPALAVVRRPAPRPAPAKPAPEPVAGAKAGESVKDLVLFEMERAQTALAAAIKGMGDASAERPLAAGRWSTRQVLLHLVGWDRAVLPALEVAYARDERPPLTREAVDRINAENVARLGHHDWAEAQRLLHAARADLRAAFEAIPEEPAEVWSPQHAVGWMARFIAGHDRHHADQIKAARLAAAEDPA